MVDIDLHRHGGESSVCGRRPSSLRRRDAPELRLVDHLDAEGTRPSSASTRRSRRPPRSPSSSTRWTRPGRRPSCASSVAFSRVMEGIVPVSTIVVPGERTLRRDRDGPFVGHPDARRPQPLDQRQVLRVLEPFADGRRDLRADARHVVDVVDARRAPTRRSSRTRRPATGRRASRRAGCSTPRAGARADGPSSPRSGSAGS